MAFPFWFIFPHSSSFWFEGQMFSFDPHQLIEFRVSMCAVCRVRFDLSEWITSEMNNSFCLSSIVSQNNWKSFWLAALLGNFANALEIIRTVDAFIGVVVSSWITRHMDSTEKQLIYNARVFFWEYPVAFSPGKLVFNLKISLYFRQSAFRKKNC